MLRDPNLDRGQRDMEWSRIFIKHCFIKCIHHLLYLVPQDLPVLVPCKLLIKADSVRGRLPVDLAFLKEILLVLWSAWNLVGRDLHKLRLNQHVQVSLLCMYINVHVEVTMGGRGVLKED